MRFQLWDEAVTITLANVRREPNGEKIGQYLPGTRLVVTGGPVERGDLVWWQVRNGFTGWVAENAPNQAVILDKWDDSPFGQAMRFVLGQEGGEVNHREDPGGYTKWGIAQAFNPQVNVATMTLDQAKRIYREKYWEVIAGDKLPWPLAVTVFDMAVNAGTGTALRLLDGVGADIAKYNEARRSYYRSLRQFETFGAGWLNRVDDIEIFIN